MTIKSLRTPAGPAVGYFLDMTSIDKAKYINQYINYMDKYADVPGWGIGADILDTLEKLNEYEIYGIVIPREKLNAWTEQFGADMLSRSIWGAHEIALANGAVNTYSLMPTRVYIKGSRSEDMFFTTMVGGRLFIGKGKELSLRYDYADFSNIRSGSLSFENIGDRWG